MTKLPPPIMTSEKGSFARKTVEILKPGIIDNILSEYDYTPQIREALLGLKNEMASGLLRQLQENTSDKPIWDKDTAPYVNNSWLEIPWFLAESFFFRRVLEATQYFQPGPWQGKDPFQHLKNKEIYKALQPFSEVYQPNTINEDKKKFQIASYHALWGNQSDLSNLEVYNATTTPQMDKLILNHTERAYEYIFTHKPIRIAYFLDNVGKELYFDLAFIDHLLGSGLAQSITCFIKNQPFFVSDAQRKDLQKTVDFLGTSSIEKCEKLSERISDWIKSTRISIEAPPFITSSRSFREIPNALKNQLTDHDLTILKGDVNFRRLVGDRHWDPETSLETAADYFYTPFLSLRTLKSELILGLTEEKLKALNNQAEEDWLINGQRGMIIFLE